LEALIKPLVVKAGLGNRPSSNLHSSKTGLFLCENCLGIHAVDLETSLTASDIIRIRDLISRNGTNEWWLQQTSRKPCMRTGRGIILPNQRRWTNCFPGSEQSV